MPTSRRLLRTGRSGAPSDAESIFAYKDELSAATGSSCGRASILWRCSFCAAL